MRLRIELDGRDHEVLVEGEPPDLHVSLGSRTFPVRVRFNGSVAVVEVDKRAITLEFRDGVRIDDRARIARVEWLTEEESAEGTASIVDVRPPMPGRVVRLLVASGDFVRRGTALVVLEAMKMQNEIPAPVAGVVREVRVREGDAVSATDVLVRLGREAKHRGPSDG